MITIISKDGIRTIRELTPQEAAELASYVPNPALVLGAWRLGASASRFQLLTALQEWPAGNLIPAANTAATAAGGRIERLFKEADHFRRMSTNVRLLLNAIGLSATDMDDLFRTAAGIEE